MAPSHRNDRLPLRACCFDRFQFNFETEELRDGLKAISVSRLGVSLLGYLINHRERLVTRDELLREVWNGVVSAESVRGAVFELRQALIDSVESPRFIQTVRGRGYRFVAEVRFPADESASDPEAHRGASLVGRDKELARLRLALADASSQEGRCCVITGPAGVGKSRMAMEARALARLQGIPCHQVWAEPDTATPALWPISQALTQIAEQRGPAALQHALSLAPLLAGLAQSSGIELQTTTSVYQDSRSALMEQIGKFFAALTSMTCGLLIVEDVHWADEASISCLARLGEILAQTKWLLLITCRDVPGRAHPLARAIRALARHPNNEHLSLGNLTFQDVQTLVGRAASARPAQRFDEEVYALSRGNPLFALELARLWDAGNHDFSRFSCEQVGALLRRRLDSLPARTLEAVETASVFGVRFSLAELAGALDATPHETLGYLDAAFSGEILTADAAGACYRFCHPLMRDAAYEGLMSSRRCELHGKAGAWIERHGSSERFAELAHHFVEGAPAGFARKAVRYSVRSAQQAYATTAFGTAQGHYERALACLGLVPDASTTERFEIELALGEAMRARAAEPAKVNAHFLALAEQAERLGLPTLFARAALGYFGQRAVRFTPSSLPVGVNLRDLSLLKQALAGIEDNAHELHVLLRCSLVHVLGSSVDRRESEELIDEAIKIARRSGEAWVLARALWVRLYYCAGPGQQDRRLVLCDELVEVAGRGRLPIDQIAALISRAVCLLARGELPAAAHDQEEARALAVTSGDTRALVRTELPDLVRAFFTADVARARSLAQRAYDVAPEDIVERAFYAMRLAALAHLENGQLTEVTVYENILATHPTAVGIRCLLASGYATFGAREQACEHFDFVAAHDFQRLPRDVNWLAGMAMLADAAVRLDDDTRAVRVYDRLQPYGHIFDFFAAEALPAGPVAHWLGDLATTFGDYQTAACWLDAARMQNEQRGAALFLQYGALAQARLLLRQGIDECRARALLDGVLDFAARHGTRWLTVCAERFLEGDVYAWPSHGSGQVPVHSPTLRRYSARFRSA
jgi:DNA-binding winged helix-turn-helix (wHTH) protein/tetratricopeptide (TPR) repeat protein